MSSILFPTVAIPKRNMMNLLELLVPFYVACLACFVIVMFWTNLIRAFSA